ncbi:MAG: hypothetical protein JWP74_1834 [Marmoricola sp.]|nr:hypothetical protein [Marmoricola sp.]
MKSPIQRRFAIAALLLLAPALGACGFSAQTDQVYQAAAGVNDRGSQIDILNALIVSDTDGSGTLSTSLVDTSETKGDTLTGVTGTGITAVSAPIEIAPGGAADLSKPAVGGGPQIALTGAAIKPGDFVTLTFTFASGQSTTIKVQVFTSTGDSGNDYTDIPLPSASDSPAAG